MSREVLVHAPTGYQPGRTYPAVVALHGSVTDVTAMPRISGLSQLADANGFLVFYLQGIDNSWNGYTCCGGSQDDVGFAKAVVEHAVKTWNADANRVYAVGHWAGGSLAYELVAELPGTFAALGVVNGAYTSAARGGRAWTAPVPVVLFLGEQGRAAPTFQTRLLDHVKDLGCPELQPAFLGANKRITRATVTCRGGIDLDVYWFRDVATEWPGPGTGATEADRRSMAVDQGFDAGEVMWAFFAKRSRKA
ncbi:alpha/beta hydrolase family esterase [Micromonospora sp. BQ11]|uniref:alpha/beta hydrolase family esterase n=1 Tax=Micromonospora sp. BQ11 TaxID=3452212 RepID=UPI003F888BF0